jgi:hypothetical protein
MTTESVPAPEGEHEDPDDHTDVPALIFSPDALAALDPEEVADIVAALESGDVTFHPGGGR